MTEVAQAPTTYERSLVVARDLFALPYVPDDALAGDCQLLGRIRIILELTIDHFRLTASGRRLPTNGGSTCAYERSLVTRAPRW